MPPQETPVILIGPMQAGKSTLAQVLAPALGLPRLELDQVRYTYYNEIGYDEEEARRIYHSPAGQMGIIRYWKPFEAHAVTRVVQDYPAAVIDFGAGHSVYEDPHLFAKVQQALAGLAYVFLLLPSPDLALSTRILNQRMAALLKEEGITETAGVLKLNEHFVRHPSNAALATHTIYTEGKTTRQTCTEMLALMGKDSPEDWLAGE